MIAAEAVPRRSRLTALLDHAEIENQRDVHLRRAAEGRLAVAALSAGEHARTVVPRPGRRAGRAHPADRDRRHGAQAPGRALALR